MGKQRRAFAVADAVMGLAIVGILSTALAVTIVRQGRASAALGDSRAAARLAERVLCEMQAGMASGGEGVSVRRLADASPVRGTVWVEVKAERDGRAATLAGLVRPEVLAERRAER